MTFTRFVSVTKITFSVDSVFKISTVPLTNSLTKRPPFAMCGISSLVCLIVCNDGFGVCCCAGGRDFESCNCGPMKAEPKSRRAWMQVEIDFISEKYFEKDIDRTLTQSDLQNM